MIVWRAGTIFLRESRTLELENLVGGCYSKHCEWLGRWQDSGPTAMQSNSAVTGIEKHWNLYDRRV